MQPPNITLLFFLTFSVFHLYIIYVLQQKNFERRAFGFVLYVLYMYYKLILLIQNVIFSKEDKTISIKSDKNTLTMTESVLKVLVLCWTLCSCSVSPASSRPPNVLIFLVDDLGYGDLGYTGHPTISSPNIDRLARDGLVLTEFYAASPVCTPSRASLLTGKFSIQEGGLTSLTPLTG